MIYLDNTTSPQNVWIPRNDGNGYVHTGSSQSYQEGYADGVNDQKAKLASTAFTENGEYQRNDGWSAITVNVPQSGSVLECKEIVVSQDVTIVVPTSGYDGFSAVTIDATEYGQTNYDSGFDDGFTDGYSSGTSEGYDSGYTEGYQSGSTDGYESGYTSGQTDGYNSGYTEGYDSGSTDGFNSGYTSGETHQKSLLVSTAFTENRTYTRENGYSAITVNVPIPNIEANKEFTATTNGDYTIMPSTASTTVNAYLNTWNQYIISIDFNGYPSGYFNVLTIKSDDDNKYINVYYNGNMPYHNSIGWIGDPVSYEYKSSTQLTLHINNANANYGWEKNSGFLDPYDAMSAVTLNVNVPQTGHTDQELEDAYNSGYTSGETVGENTIIATFTATTATTNGVYGSSANPLSSITVNVPSSSGGSEDFAKLIDRSITEVVIPSGVTKVGSYSFDACSSLSSVTIPNSVTSLGTSSFNGCTSLSAITIPSGVTSIDSGCFRNCSMLNTIYAYPTTAPTLSNATSSLNSPFKSVSSSGTIHYPQGSDYSSWQSAVGISGWTFISDL